MKIGRRKGKKWGDKGEHEQVFLTLQQLLKQKQAGIHLFGKEGPEEKVCMPQHLEDRERVRPWVS